jgi:CBS domain-containing protein
MPLKPEKMMVKNVVTAKAGVTTKRAVEIMNKHEIVCLVVVNGEKPVGIVTERDMLKGIIHKLKEPEKTSVTDMTSKPLIAAASKMNAEDTAKFMFERKIKKLPIVENGRLVGLVTLTDLIRS